jgi:hypothetical protein
MAMTAIDFHEGEPRPTGCATPVKRFGHNVIIWPLCSFHLVTRTNWRAMEISNE